MANTTQATKRARQAEKTRQHKAGQRAAMRTTIKKLLAVIKTDDKAAANVALRVCQSSLDGMARKGVIAKNKASRLISRLNARVKAMA